MKDKKGILATLDAEISLEDKIAFELQKVLSGDSPTEKYSDRQDLQNVRRRKLIVAALHAILQHQIEKLTDDDGSAIIELADDTNPFNELSAAFRGLLHDFQRLNEGMQAERVASRRSYLFLSERGNLTYSITASWMISVLVLK